MYGLVIDTSTTTAILGILSGPNEIKFQTLEGAKKLSETLFPVLETFYDLKDLSYIAVGVGPGSYMGVRTAATIAKTLAFALEIPLLEFPSPLAFLPRCVSGSFAFIGDAKMGQFYLITGTGEKKGMRATLSGPILIDKSQPLEKKDFIIGDGHLPPEPNLSWVAPFINQQYIQKKFTTPSKLELSYIR